MALGILTFIRARRESANADMRRAKPLKRGREAAAGRPMVGLVDSADLPPEVTP
jgi:hypothetical protein